MSDLSAAPALPHLTSLSLSFTPNHRVPHTPQLSLADLPIFPPLPRLTSLLLTLSGDRSSLPSGGIQHLLAQVDAARLTRLSLINLFIGPTALSHILAAAPSLEELYISVNSRQTIMDHQFTSGGLRILHINAPGGFGLTVDDLTEIARAVRTLEQVGSGNRVFEVVRRWEGEAVVVELARWGRVDTPGYFQVWRG